MTALPWRAALVALALASSAGCRGGGPATLSSWKGARFSVSHPSGWAVREATDERVVFDGTRPHGAFRVGRELEVRLMPGPVPSPVERFDVHCGSHLCDARLEVETGRWRLVLVESCNTDSCPREADLEAGLKELAKAVLPTLAAAAQ